MNERRHIRPRYVSQTGDDALGFRESLGGREALAVRRPLAELMGYLGRSLVRAMRWSFNQIRRA
jgi:hypothetical protein